VCHEPFLDSNYMRDTTRRPPWIDCIRVLNCNEKNVFHTLYVLFVLPFVLVLDLVCFIDVRSEMF
jgi:hypothetical protein